MLWDVCRKFPTLTDKSSLIFTSETLRSRLVIISKRFYQMAKIQMKMKNLHCMITIKDALNCLYTYWIAYQRCNLNLSSVCFIINNHKFGFQVYWPYLSADSWITNYMLVPQIQVYYQRGKLSMWALEYTCTWSQYFVWIIVYISELTIWTW